MGINADEYPLFKVLNRDVIKPAVKEINELTDFCIEVEQKRKGRKVAFLKFRISRLKRGERSEPEPLYPDVEELPALANTLVQAGVVRREAIKIAHQAWGVVEVEVVMEDYRDFEVYVDEKIGLAQQATQVRNVGGFIVQAIRENYQDPVFQERLEERKEQEREAMLKALESELSEKRSALLRQAVRTHPELLERAAERIQSRFVRERLARYDSLQAAYRDGGMVTAEINEILAEEFCSELLAPVYAAYEAEKKQILE